MEVNGCCQMFDSFFKISFFVFKLRGLEIYNFWGVNCPFKASCLLIKYSTAMGSIYCSIAQRLMPLIMIFCRQRHL